MRVKKKCFSDLLVSSTCMLTHLL